MSLSPPELFSAAREADDFDCSKPSLNHWLNRRAPANQERKFTAVLVVHEAMRMVGYYGLAPTSVIPAILSRSVRTGQPSNHVACLLLGQFACDLAWAGQGLGSGLLRHALRRCLEASRLVGGCAVVVNAIDDEAEAFWLSKGLLPSRDDPSVLFQSIGAIAASLAAAER